MERYPEHEKLAKIKDKSQTIGEFLEWLERKYLVICEGDCCDWSPAYDYFPTHKSTQQLLAEYFEIDLQKIALEKEEMVKEYKTQLEEQRYE